MFNRRPVTAGDVPFRWNRLWEAAAEELCAIGNEASLALSQVEKYLAGWGRAGDFGVIAVDAPRRPLGAAWARLFPTDRPVPTALRETRLP